MSLLSTSMKIEKSDNSPNGYLTKILYLAPHKLSGYNVCQDATPECIKGCINTSGFGGVFPAVQQARIRKTKEFFENRPHFLYSLQIEVDLFQVYCGRKNKKPALRLNGLSDLPWERICSIIQDNPRVQFYDYTKIRSRMRSYLAGEMPPNYHLTFSLAENNLGDCLEFIGAGGSCAAVFGCKPHEVPRQWLGVPVFNGDATDLRFLDPPGAWVGLYAKGRMRNISSDFIVSVA